MEEKIKIIQKLLPEIMRYNFRKPKSPVNIEVNIPLNENMQDEYRLHISSYDGKHYPLFIYEDLRVMTIAKLKKRVLQVRKYIRENA